MDIKTLLQELTPEEKAYLVAGQNFMYTAPVERLNIPALSMSDGPHGLRKQAAGGDNGVMGSEPATSFPTAATVASGWDPENARKVGEGIAAECRHYGVHVILGPASTSSATPCAAVTLSITPKILPRFRDGHWRSRRCAGAGSGRFAQALCAQQRRGSPLHGQQRLR